MGCKHREKDSWEETGSSEKEEFQKNMRKLAKTQQAVTEKCVGML